MSSMMQVLGNRERTSAPDFKMPTHLPLANLVQASNDSMMAALSLLYKLTSDMDALLVYMLQRTVRQCLSRFSNM